MVIDYIPRDRKLSAGEYVAKVHSVRFEYTKRQKTTYTIRKIIDRHGNQYLLRRGLLEIEAVEDIMEGELFFCKNVTLRDKLLYIIGAKRCLQRKRDSNV